MSYVHHTSIAVSKSAHCDTLFSCALEIFLLTYLNQKTSSMHTLTYANILH